jgi:hypothetical protein
MQPRHKNKFKFVLVTSDSCIHCSIFKQNILTNLQDAIVLKYKNQLDWLHINIPTFELHEERGYPRGLRNLINWFPIILLIPNDLWESDDLTKGLERIRILNGRIRNGKSEIERKYNMNLEDILRWVNEELRTMSTSDDMMRNENLRSRDFEEKNSYWRSKKQRFRERRLINFNL